MTSPAIMIRLGNVKKLFQLEVPEVPVRVCETTVDYVVLHEGKGHSNSNSKLQQFEWKLKVENFKKTSHPPDLEILFSTGN